MIMMAASDQSPHLLRVFDGCDCRRHWKSQPFLGYQMEGTMNTRASANNPLDVIAPGWGLSAALVVLFVICLAVAVVLPGWRAAHGWIGLFSVAPMTSVRVWIDGIVFSIVFGWVTGVVLGLVYNRLIRR